MVIFGLSTSQGRLIDDNCDFFRIKTVEITLEDGSVIQLNAGVNFRDHSLEVLPIEERRWTLSELTRSELFKLVEESTFEEEKILENGTKEELTPLQTA